MRKPASTSGSLAGGWLRARGARPVTVGGSLAAVQDESSSTCGEQDVALGAEAEDLGQVAHSQLDDLVARARLRIRLEARERPHRSCRLRVDGFCGPETH